MDDPQVEPAPAGVELRSLSIRVADRLLLESACASFPAGRVTLVIGCSGVGKSLLLRALAGLVDKDAAVAIGGEAFAGGAKLSPYEPNENVGVVFQSFALFDELSPLENVRFASHHATSASRASSGGPSEALIDELHVPRRVPTAALSGGQKQRLAIARALAFDSPVVLYDEPTSGLDDATARRVAALIHDTQSAHPKTSVVVTHDYQSLSSIADRVFLFDGESRALREIPREDWPRLSEKLQPPAADDEATLPQEKPAARRLVERAVGATGAFFEATSKAAEAAIGLPLALVPRWRSVYWGLRFLAHYLRLIAGPSAWLYMAISGAIIGYVATYFSFRFLPYAQVTRPLITEELLTSIGFALYRVLVPILATILIAARSGAAAASDVGGKTYGRQVDAMRILGARPKPYLLTNVLWSFLLGSPVLVGIAYLSAAAASVAVFSATHPDRGPWFWRLHFHKAIVAPGDFFYIGSGWLLAKTLCCAAGIAAISYHVGARPKDSPTEVSRGITGTILWATLYVLVVHFAFAFFEFERNE